ncbi:LSU ribosomal protein L7AE [Syntrophobotulus glycolicus DSM 8271]|uniref:LSU ribosomal protein L7AE n=1 Tax=Syntrophobotulus glycolicus (strain DSM 8271 / FlGlyR) TaxID=645991 RepID=F0SU91_SYNGF|nr:L7Ae/L30e/S12e/Gadd45 family protein [Syntrophobotulus glycolicus]ADY56541.1 LSU ribosomal protein L7AE [Syntrophobotulus glycolicus DSM 8271]
MTERFESLLGMAMKAGKIAFGSFQVEGVLKRKKGFLLIVAGDASTTAKYEMWAKDLGIQVLTGGSKVALGRAIGQSPKAVLMIMDKGFAEAIKKTVEQSY